MHRNAHKPNIMFKKKKDTYTCRFFCPCLNRVKVLGLFYSRVEVT